MSRSRRKVTDFMLVLSAVRYLKEATATELIRFVSEVYSESKDRAKLMVKTAVREGEEGGIYTVVKSRVRISKYLMDSREYRKMCGPCTCTTCEVKKVKPGNKHCGKLGLPGRVKKEPREAGPVKTAKPRAKKPLLPRRLGRKHKLFVQAEAQPARRRRAAKKPAAKPDKEGKRILREC